jgi:hypothetical protein
VQPPKRTGYHASMEAVADLVARHALLVLFGATLALLMAR